VQQCCLAVQLINCSCCFIMLNDCWEQINHIHIHILSLFSPRFKFYFNRMGDQSWLFGSVLFHSCGKRLHYSTVMPTSFSTCYDKQNIYLSIYLYLFCWKLQPLLWHDHRRLWRPNIAPCRLVNGTRPCEIVIIIIVTIIVNVWTFSTCSGLM